MDEDNRIQDEIGWFTTMSNWNTIPAMLGLALMLTGFTIILPRPTVNKYYQAIVIKNDLKFNF